MGQIIAGAVAAIVILDAVAVHKILYIKADDIQSHGSQIRFRVLLYEKKNELAIQKAELKREADIKQAEADAAYKIQEEEQRKTVEITTADANIAKQASLPRPLFPSRTSSPRLPAGARTAGRLQWLRMLLNLLTV